MTRDDAISEFMELFSLLSDEHKAEFLKAMRVTAGEDAVPAGMVPVLVDQKFWYVAADELARLKASGHTVSEVPLPEPDSGTRGGAS
jgi:hypothetical protein